LRFLKKHYLYCFLNFAEILEMISQETIVALATPSGAGAIAIIRLSGNEAIIIAEQVFQSVSGKAISKQKTQQLSSSGFTLYSMQFYNIQSLNHSTSKQP
jgi:hypothetical protein